MTNTPTDEELEAISDQAEMDIKKLFQSQVPSLVMCAEIILENFVKVICGEKRIAIVPRTHAKVKEGPVYELRLVTSPKPSRLSPKLSAEELEALAEDVPRAKAVQFGRTPQQREDDYNDARAAVENSKSGSDRP